MITRVVDELGSLRKRDLYHAIKEATVTVYRHDMDTATFRIVHASIQRTHLHLMVEAKHETAMAEGLQVFLSAAARRIDRALWRRTHDDAHVRLLGGRDHQLNDDLREVARDIQALRVS